MKEEKLQELFQQIQKKKDFSGRDFQKLNHDEKEEMIKAGFDSLGKKYKASSQPVKSGKTEKKPEKKAAKSRKSGGLMGLARAFWGSEIWF